MFRDCYQCGKGYLIPKHGTYKTHSVYIGSISTPNVKWKECDNCSDALLSLEICKAIDKETDKKIKKLLECYPVKDFVFKDEVIKILNMSEKEFSNNERIEKRIWKIEIGNKILYLRKSVQKFKKTKMKEGRFILSHVLIENISEKN